MPKYFGEYVDFETLSKKDSGYLLGADNMVGDVYDLDVELDQGEHRAYLVNRFDKRIGFLDSATSRKISLLKADGLICKAILSFVAFTSVPDEGHYWGQVAVMCFSPSHDSEFTTFMEGVAKRIGQDVRPKIDLDAEGVEKVIESDGQWLPSQNISLPDKTKEMAIIKRKRKFSDALIEQGRAGNKGCYVASWIFMLAVVALIVLCVKGCMGW